MDFPGLENIDFEKLAADLQQTGKQDNE